MKFETEYQEHRYAGQAGKDPLSVSFYIMDGDYIAAHGVVDWQDDLRIAQMECVSLEEWDELSRLIKEAYVECIKRLGDQWKLGHGG